MNVRERYVHPNLVGIPFNDNGREPERRGETTAEG